MCMKILRRASVEIYKLDEKKREKRNKEFKFTIIKKGGLQPFKSEWYSDKKQVESSVDNKYVRNEKNSYTHPRK